MLGAVCGDVIGSYYEVHCTKDYDFPLLRPESSFTDDTVLTAAVCDAILYRGTECIRRRDQHERAEEYAARYRAYYRRYPDAGFGQMFSSWACGSEKLRQRSFGNGGAMRVVPIGYAYDSLEETLRQAKLSCLSTHAHPKAIRAAKAVAASVYCARCGGTRDEIRAVVERVSGYQFDTPLHCIRAQYRFNAAAQDSVPQAIAAFLESDSYEDAVRIAVSLGGDADTMACIAGGIAEAFYGSIPGDIRSACLLRLDSGLKATFREFLQRYCTAGGFSA